MKLRIGDLVFDGDARELSLGAEVRRLEPKAAALLIRLAAAPMQSLRRQELLDAGWPDGSGSDEALTQAIAQVRRALALTPGGGAYIQTIARTGYRLRVDVGPVDAAAGVRVAPKSDTAHARAAFPPQARAWPIVLGGLIVVLLGIVTIAPGAPHRLRHLIFHTFGVMRPHASVSPQPHQDPPHAPTRLLF